jgi:hypothetical protein
MSYNAREKPQPMRDRFEEATGTIATVSRRSSLTAVVLAVAVFTCVLPRLAAQNATHADLADRVRGVVINSVTHEPISRALVLSPDNSFATMTDDRGRFEVIFTSAPPEQPMTFDTNSQQQFQALQKLQAFQNQPSNRPNALMARKVGFVNSDIPVDISDIKSTDQILTISLVPEARIVGHVILPGSDGSDKMQVSLYRRNVREDQEHWDLVSNAATRADGEFRLAELPPGSYKLLTLEQLDRDPLTYDPRGQVFGYPPLYYPGASDFETAAIIHLAPGETFQPTMSPTKRPYYPVNLGFTTPVATPQIQISVWPQAHPGPGYSLGYNQRDGDIEGLLPDGTYTLQATNYGPAVMGGQLSFTVGGAPVSGPALTLLPGNSIAVNVREEFQHTQSEPAPQSFTSFGKVSAPAPNNRRPNYLQVTLLPDEVFGLSFPASLRSPSGPDDEWLAIENVLPGRYRVIVNTSIGYAASITSGGTDLLRQPLIVGSGTSVPPLEITVRDDGAEIEGTIDSPNVAVNRSGGNNPYAQQLGFVCLAPMDRMDDRCKIAWANNNDGAFTFQQLAPGSYRALAMDRSRPQPESLDKEFVAQHERKIQVIHVVQEQKQQLHLPLITASE